MATIPFSTISLPSATAKYDQQQQNRLIRTIELALRTLYQAGAVRATSLNILDIPTSGYGLEIGDVYATADGVLHIVREGEAFLLGVSSAGAAGTFPP